MKTIKERFEGLSLATDAIAGRIQGFTKSVSDNGTWYTFVVSVLIKNKYEQFVCKLNAGKENDEYIAKTDEYFAAFQDGDYILTNVNIRVKGEKWESEDGKTSGVYGSSYLNVPFTSDMIYQGANAIQDLKEKEATFANLEFKAMKLQEE